MLPKTEFETRLAKIRLIMQQKNWDIFLIYGDEYRRENLRYVSNYWPIFERGMLAVGLNDNPVLLVSPECEHLAKEMSAYNDIRLVRELGMSYVPEEVGFVNISFTTISDVINELSKTKTKLKIAISGMDAMSVDLYNRLSNLLPSAELINADNIIYKLRLIKSPAEIEILKKVWEICDTGYKALLDTDIVGMTEIQAAAIAEKAARDAGAESIVFSVLGSGDRSNVVVGRPTEKIIKDGDMIMSCLCMQYDGYIASDEWPYVAGKKRTIQQLELIKHLITVEDIIVKNLKAGVVSGEVVKAAQDYFTKNDLSKYDLYPPMHGNGLAEAEMPYPDADSKYLFERGMGVNTDVSLFGYPNAGSNRIEEGFSITENGVIVLSKLINKLKEEFLS